MGFDVFNGGVADAVIKDGEELIGFYVVVVLGQKFFDAAGHQAADRYLVFGLEVAGCRDVLHEVSTYGAFGFDGESVFFDVVAMDGLPGADYGADADDGEGG